jgi:hypothetical protein
MSRINIGLGVFPAIAVVLGTLQLHAAEPQDHVVAAVADPARPADQVAWDAGRKPSPLFRSRPASKTPTAVTRHRPPATMKAWS